MATISDLAIGLSLSAGGFYAGMSKAEGRLGNLKTAVGAVAAGLLALGGAGSLTGMVERSMEAIDANAKLADRLNVTTESLTGLQHGADLAGVGNEELTAGLQKLQRNLGAAANGSAETKAHFENLGLDVAELSKMPLADVLGKVADATNALPNSFAKSAAQVELFGKAGQRMNAFLADGSEGMRKNTEEAAKLGISYSRIDAGKVEQANDAMTRASAVIKGIGNLIAVEVSPFITALADGFTGAATSAIDMGEAIHQAMELVLTAADKLNKSQKLFQIGGQHIARGFLIVANMVESDPGQRARNFEAIDAMQARVQELGNEVKGAGLAPMFDDIRARAQAMAENPALVKYRDDFAALQKRLESGAITQADFAKGTEALQAALEKANVARGGGAAGNLVPAEALEGVRKLNESLQEQLATFGMTSGQIEIFKLKQKGATDEMLRFAEAAQKDIDLLKIMEGNAGPLDKFAKELQGLDALREQAGVAMGEELDLAAAKAFEGLEKSLPTIELKSPEAISRGSKEATSLILQNQMQRERESQDPQERVVRVMERAEKIQGQQLERLKDIADAVKQQKVADF